MKKEQLKILHIMSGFGGGISSFIRNKAEYMVNENIQFDVVTYDECPEDFKKVINQTGGDIYTMVNPKTNGWRAFKESFTRVLKENSYDIIYCHLNGYRVLPYYYYAQKYSAAPFYVHAHSSHYPDDMLSIQKKISIQIDQAINRRVTDKVVGCGSLSINSIFGEKVSQENIVVIPNSVEVNRFIKKTEEQKRLRQMNRTNYQIADDEIVIGHIGRLETIKNHELTIKLAEYIRDNDLYMKILIIGEGNRESELKAVVEQKDLNDIITFTGRISPIEDFFPTLDVMLLPSFTEGLPTVVVEAQASGIPVVMSETITDEVDLGFNMIEKVSLDAKPSKWISAITKTQEAQVPDEAVRERVIKDKKFSNEASADLYKEFLQGKISKYKIK